MDFKRLLLLTGIIFYQLVSSALSQGIFDILKFGQSISALLEPASDQQPKESVPISSDDLFEGLSDIWSQKEEARVHGQKRTQYEPPPVLSNPSKTDSLDWITTTQDNVIETTSSTTLNQQSSNQNDQDFNQNSESNHSFSNQWTRIKSIVANMKSTFLDMFQPSDYENEMHIIKMLDKLEDIGDKINLVKEIESGFDNELLQYLHQKWDATKDQMLHSSPSLKVFMSIDMSKLFVVVARGLAKQFGHILHNQALAHLNEQDFVIDTMRTSGFKDQEIYDVFKLLDVPTDSLVSTSETLQQLEESRSMNNRYLDRSGGHSGGYGSGGSVHGGGGYGMMSDPFILLAGLAFAAFAAYIIYRLLSSTAAGKRSIGMEPDTFMSLSLSDMPEAVSRLLTWIEKADAKYGEDERETFANPEESLVRSINELWTSFTEDRFDRSCLKRYFCHHLEANSFRISASGSTFEEWALMALAEILGEEGIGRIFDGFTTNVLEGRSLKCNIKGQEHCPDSAFKKILYKYKKKNS